MSDPVDVVWSAQDSQALIELRSTTIMPPWAGIAINAEQTANAICEDYFTPDVWRGNGATDDDVWNVKFEIHSPAEVAGKFDVRLARTVKATARRAST